MNTERLNRLRTQGGLAIGFAALACALHFLAALETLPAFWYAFAAHVLLLVIAELLVGNAAQQSPHKFTSSFMALTMIRLMLGGALIFVYLFFVRDQIIAFAAAFFLMYFTGTAFEIKMLLSILRDK